MSTEIKKWLLYLVIDVLKDMTTSRKQLPAMRKRIFEAIDTLEACAYLLEKTT